jgi:hypothetical protein
VRLRWQRRVCKRLRKSSVLRDVRLLEAQGLSLSQALRAVLIRPGFGHFEESDAGRLLALDGSSRAVDALLDRFFTLTEKDDLYVTALRLENLNDKRAVRPLIHALLHDTNPHRRHAAARALGWIQRPGCAAALALARCLADPSQPQAAREEAAESLHYVGTAQTVDALTSVLKDPDVRLRFWAVFGLGGITKDPRAVRALESMLDDAEVTPGNWWSVGKEALGMLANTDAYRDRCEAEAARISQDPNATPEELRWARSYGE